MLNCYHTHTHRCKHAEGTDEEYIIKAIAEGVRVLGFSDHAPFIYPDGSVSYYKMTPSEAGEYFTSLRALADKYKDKIQILVGYEAEYYPDLWEETLNFSRSTNPPDYLILGQHHAGEEYIKDPKPSRIKTDSEETLKEYVDLVIAGVETGRFTYVAHPDLINYIGNPEIYDREIKRMLGAISDMKMPIEYNLLGLVTKRNYPNERFLELARGFDLSVVLGCDAHEPSRVASKEEIKIAVEHISSFGLKLVDEVKIVDPFARDIK